MPGGVHVSAEQCRRIRERCDRGITRDRAADVFGVSPNTIRYHDLEYCDHPPRRRSRAAEVTR